MTTRCMFYVTHISEGFLEHVACLPSIVLLMYTAHTKCIALFGTKNDIIVTKIDSQKVTVKLSPFGYVLVQ